FSSRRRHTRWPRDWSSDVCSSDLQVAQLLRLEDASHPFDHGHGAADGEHHQGDEERPEVQLLAVAERVVGIRRPGAAALPQVERSEERRVGKEGGGRWWPRRAREY